MTEQLKDATDQVKDTAEGATGSLREQATGAIAGAARDILGPAIQQMSEQAARQAAEYAKDQGPKLVREQVLPAVLKSAGVDSPGDLAKQGIGKVGEAVSGAGGIAGIAGKLASKLGGGKGGGTATGYGQKRRMPVQQDLFVSVSVENAYKGWTEYKRWTEFMHRANLVSPEPDEQAFRLKVTEKMWGFKRPFTAEVVSQVPNEHIRWKSTEGTKHVGVIAFHPLGDRLTLISVNVDHAPSGLIEKAARGNRFVKRAIRADLHRFKGWVEHKSDDEIDELEGWLGTIQDGQITVAHEDAVDEQPAEQSQDIERADEEERPPDEDDGWDEVEAEEEEPEEQEEEEEEEEPEPQPRRRRSSSSRLAR